MTIGKHEYWLTEEGLLILAAWARDGLTDEQIARNMGICPSTLRKYKKKYPDISETLRKNKEIVDYKVENALLKTALSGSITAQKFWLKNRKPEKWRENPPEDIENAMAVIRMLVKSNEEVAKVVLQHQTGRCDT